MQTLKRDSSHERVFTKPWNSWQSKQIRSEKCCHLDREFPRTRLGKTSQTRATFWQVFRNNTHNVAEQTINSSLCLGAYLEMRLFVCLSCCFTAPQQIQSANTVHSSNVPVFCVHPCAPALLQVTDWILYRKCHVSMINHLFLLGLAPAAAKFTPPTGTKRSPPPNQHLSCMEQNCSFLVVYHCDFSSLCNATATSNSTAVNMDRQVPGFLLDQTMTGIKHTAAFILTPGSRGSLLLRSNEGKISFRLFSDKQKCEIKQPQVTQVWYEDSF